MLVPVFPKLQKQGVNEMNDYVFLFVISGAQKQGESEANDYVFGNPRSTAYSSTIQV
jgi:hypothetical protein